MCLLQEPWTGGDGRVRGLSGFKGKIYACEPSNKPRACILTSDVEAELLPQFLNRDLVAVKMKIGGVESVVAFAYFPHPVPSPPVEVIELVEYCKEGNMQILIECDANSHHVSWGSNDTNQRGEELLNYLCEADMCIFNRGSKPTFRNAIRSEVLDLTIGCRKMERLVSCWEVSDEVSLSDHMHISYSVEANIAPNGTAYIHNPRRTDWVAYEESLTKLLPRAPEHLPTPGEVDECCDLLTSAIVRAY